uniref:Multi-functional beta-1,4 beta-xylosidase, alpha-1,5 alpha-arabinofurpyranosidase, beta-1,4 lactase, alpha-1,6 raffinase, alpha-1,6 stachyase and alpha-1,4 alpha-glucosidase GHF13 n=1 Tax=uncultured bacterium r_02 TaxID=1132277 RepID=I6XP21_9BACT|nr:multi-functional beta-1,4 beta-xylosidase, alpha-1,5 alpha-arabinofurpyranosidase, beta-1,4 lactase, alpha-1,6 raffinase, alpha-1,6 stachyase and alpha-1,4 alpha-glucosidase GHF13 [uncultured bacterium r_02]
MGVSHIWYTGIIRHATQTDYSAFGIPKNHSAIVKGKAGSPYAITDYYDVDPDLATDVSQRMQEFEALIERTHKAGLKVIIDFVPNHVARQYHSICKPQGVKDLGEGDNPQNGFDPQNNFYYCPGQRFTPYFDLYHGEEEPYIEEPAKATGNDCFHNAPGMNDWYETVKLNYGLDYYAGRVGHFNPIPDTWDKMTDILLFWAAKGVDGFRCDMAEMVPAAFWHWATDKVKFRYPDIVFIGEVYNPAEYRNYLGAGFDYLYDKVGMYDTLREVMCGRQSTHAITGAWQQTDDIHDHMLYFLENHDEQRIASSFFAGDARKGVPALVVSALLQQNPLMIYFAQEYGERGMDKEGFSGQDGRTTIFDYWSVDTMVRAAQRKLTKDEKALSEIYTKVMTIAASEKAVADGVSFDLMYVNNQYHRQYAFLRKAGSEVLLVVVNFDSIPSTMNVTIPTHAFDYLKIKEKTAQATDLLSGEKLRLTLRRDAAVNLTLQPLGALILKFKA